MGHLLATSNPQAAENYSPRPMPVIGNVVRYHPRVNDVRQGRVVVPAIVLNVDEGNRHLELLVIHSSDDMITQQRVAEHVEGDRGWSRIPAENHGDQIEVMVRLIDELEERIAKIENRPQAVERVKRKYTRRQAAE